MSYWYFAYKLRNMLGDLTSAKVNFSVVRSETKHFPLFDMMQLAEEGEMNIDILTTVEISEEDYEKLLLKYTSQ